VLDAQPDIEVVGEAATGTEAVTVCRQLRPDLVLMDIRMPELDGLAATRQLLGGDRESGPRVLMLTTFDADEYVYGALGAGASGFLLKDSPLDDLVAAVRMVAAGNALFAPAVTRRVIAGFAGRRPRTQDAARLADLTARELEVLRLIAQGLSNLDIAGQLVIAEQTAKTHVSRVLGKLGLRDRAQAVVLAYEAKLVVPGE
jgi:DNA-binding NarL/FixJ family response regulator